jgi:hypothetical protein
MKASMGMVLELERFRGRLGSLLFGFWGWQDSVNKRAVETKPRQNRYFFCVTIQPLFLKYYFELQ